MALLLLIQRVVILLLKLFAGNEGPGWLYLIPILTGLVLWQLMLFLFGELTHQKPSH